MEAISKILNILFRRIPPEQILQRMRQPFGGVVGGDEIETLTLRYASTDLGNYSQDERQMIYLHAKSNVDDFIRREQLDYLLENQTLTLPCASFIALIYFSSRILTSQADEPLCRTHEVGLWRKTYLALGQDLMVCAYLAYEDFRRRREERLDFTWQATIRTDHKALNHQLAKGIAENHFHLYGSTQTFPLSWCSLMNYPRDLEAADWRQFDQFLQPVSARSPDDCLFSSKERVRYAALFRSNLFCRLHPEAGIKANGNRSDFHPEVQVRRRIQTLLYLYGAEVPQPNGRTARLDYALEERFFQARPDAPYRCLAGERSLLYRCFRAFLQGDMNAGDQQIFYLYIVLKLLFRSEMMQVNHQTGFQNFKDYQDRKGSMIRQEAYWTEAIRMGLNAPLQEGNVTSLEARITPRVRASQYWETVWDVDRKEKFARPPEPGQDPDPFPPERVRRNVGSEDGSQLPYFYVMHFLKQPDVPPLSQLDQECRHHALRSAVRTQAVALAKALSNSPWLCSRMRGIDSSSGEIGCPPEVFASAFRFLRGFRSEEYSRPSPFRKAAVPRLSATYHVGEDFLELASGLRAIDESVVFLELQRDDRLGHALGLGTPPEAYYARKGRRLYIKKQERLDDLVWLLYRGQELGVEIGPELRSLLAKEAETLLLYIYKDSQATLLQYHCAMQLRGDDPGLYASGEYQKLGAVYDQFDLFRFSRRGPELETYRETKILSELYFRYQFDYDDKKRGREIQQIEITPEYILLMRQVQDKLQARLARENIVIECNPSSNVLIGSFGAYQRHPVFYFYGGGLFEEKAPPVQVCVNTDDLGIFDTSLAFEYALLFYAMEEKLTADLKKRFRTNEVLGYLQDLQDMSALSTFPGCRGW